MKIKTLKRKALSMCLVVAIVATYSMVALAGENKIVGEILISGNSLNGQTPIVTVNGEAVKSGRTIFTLSTITTADNASAVVNINNLGKVKIAPKSTLLISFDKDGITGNLSSGQLTVLSSSDTVSIKTADGKVAQLNSGETAVSAKQDDDDDDDTGSAWWLWAIVFGGAAAGIIFAASTNNNRVDLGGGAVVISPNF
jgi:hypothetical protein